MRYISSCELPLLSLRCKRMQPSGRTFGLKVTESRPVSLDFRQESANLQENGREMHTFCLSLRGFFTRFAGRTYNIYNV